MSNFSRVQSKADFQFLDEHGKSRPLRGPAAPPVSFTSEGPRLDASRSSGGSAAQGFKPSVGLEMGLFGFQFRPVSGPEIVDFGGLNGPIPVQSPFKVVGREAPNHFKWLLNRFKAV